MKTPPPYPPFTHIRDVASDWDLTVPTLRQWIWRWNRDNPTRLIRRQGAWIHLGDFYEVKLSKMEEK